MSEIERISQKSKGFKQREEQILNCAMELFLSHGEDKVTVEMIAEKVGIGKGTIYKHFETKNEIYLLLMIRYERYIESALEKAKEKGGKDWLAREYFKIRTSDPKRSQLFERLENKLDEDKSVKGLIERLYEIRNINLKMLLDVIQDKIDNSVLNDKPAYFHLCAAWALVNGAVALRENKFYKNIILDETGFMEYLENLVVHMGNKTGKQ